MAAASASGFCGASRRGRGRAESEETVALRPESLEQPRGHLLHAPVLGEPPRELFRCLFRLELAELRSLVGEERPRLQLEERRDEHEELAARLEVELVALRHTLDEGEHDRSDVDLARSELLLEQEREKEVEGSLERVELELELPYGRRQHGRNLAAAPDASTAASGRSRALRPGSDRPRGEPFRRPPPRPGRRGRGVPTPR